jgi:hypothetical protein
MMARPALDRPFEDWLRGVPVFVAAQQLLNRLCRAGALAGITPMLAELCNSGLRMRTGQGQGAVHATLFLSSRGDS